MWGGDSLPNEDRVSKKIQKNLSDVRGRQVFLKQNNNILLMKEMLINYVTL